MNEQRKDKIHFAGLLLELNNSSNSEICDCLGQRNIDTLLDIRKDNTIEQKRINTLNKSIRWLNITSDGFIAEQWKKRKKELYNTI